jgi:hypothetical protein
MIEAATPIERRMQRIRRSSVEFTPSRRSFTTSWMIDHLVNRVL